MEIHSSAERWDLTEAPKFVCTVIILHHNGDYFWVHSQKRKRDIEAQFYDTSIVNKIPRLYLFPHVEAGLTVFESSKDRNIFIKRPSLTSYKNTDAIAQRVLREARICEILQKHPHRNIAQYYGCINADSLIVGLCFDKYAETLSERVERGVEISDECLDKVKRGMAHIHGLGIVHNDLNQDNIMFSTLEDEGPVVIDFDSSAKRGEPLPVKRGPVPAGVHTAEFENDVIAFEKICSDIRSK
ncbi:hypothetical protein FSARC_13370 [Fusarium sarcochroum]|uniref:Protein kinase domain-containing protein n=1 Tax=Fusarium sarcochroum TaxID=1208366 RepID=A0A8H4T286_9HYPO|nr:hypothetical protein FSARC_13370 [Fusarium sarcochroum]